MILIVIGQFACAAGFQQTLAWTRYFNCTSAISAADAVGNTYVMTEVADSSPGLFDINFYIFSSSGAATKVVAPLFKLGAPAASFVWAGMATPSTHQCFTAILTSLSSKSHSIVEVIQYDPAAGSFAANTITGDTGSGTIKDVSFVGASEAVDGTVYVAASRGLPRVLETHVYPPIGGSPTGGTDLNGFQPGEARFTNGNWLIDGEDNHNAPCWILESPLAVRKLTGAYAPVDNGTNTYSYDLRTAADQAGNIYVGVTVTETQDSSGTVLLQNYFVRSYNSAGALRWTSPPSQGVIDYFCVNPAGTVIYVMGGPGGTPNMQCQMLDGTGHFVSQTPATFASAGSTLSDATGIYWYRTSDSNPAVANVDRFENSVKVWSTAYAGSVAQRTTIQSFSEIGPNLYVLALEPTATGPFQAVVQRWVSGIALSSVTGPSSVGPNSSITVKVQLNGPAPSGGILVSMTSSSPNLLFSNNTTALSLAIPTGSLYANVVLHTGAKPGTAPITVAGNQNGVIRQMTVTPTG